MPEFSKSLAVVIGINDYGDSLGRLETPVRDAEEIADLLAGSFGYEVILRRDGEATLDGLKTLLGELPEQVPEGSRLLVYFAGHGVAQNAEIEGPQGYLVPFGATSDVKTHLPMRDLHKALAGLPCRHLLVVLDCCFAGAFRWASQRPLYVPDEILYEEQYQHWVRHLAHWALASAAHDEYALDIPDRRRGRSRNHSPFAAALLDGLAGEADIWPRGGDGIITVAELYAYVQSRLAPHQTPLLSPLPGQTRGEFVFRDLRRAHALVSAEQVVQLDPGQNPYRGLKPYRDEHAALFFGREEAAGHLLRHVRRHPLTVVAGPSGSGKSSLVQAGLLPRLRLRRPSRPEIGWQVPAPIRAAKDPFAALAGALAADGGPPPPSAAACRDPEALRAWGANWVAAHPCERLLVVVDQAEELVTRVPAGGQGEAGAPPLGATAFLAALKALLEAGAGRLRVLIVVRSDYEPDLDRGPLASGWSDGRFVISPLTREELRQVVEGPASRKALYFDDPRLVDRLVDEVAGMPGGLPLLSYALSRLYIAYLQSKRRDRLLTAADLLKVGGEPAASASGSVPPGGIVRILREAADHAVADLPDPAHREALWRILLRMVNLVGARPTRRQVPLAELDYPREGENGRIAEVLRRFIDDVRLLVTDRAAVLLPGGSGAVEPAHDELLVAWPELARRIDAAAGLLPVHRRLTEAAAAWARGDGNGRGARRRRDLDLRLLSQVEANGLPADWLNRQEADYVAAARAERRRRTVQRWTLGVTTLLVTTFAALFFRYQSNIARSRELAALALATDQRDRGLLLAEAAYQVQPTIEARSSLFSLLSTLRHVEVFLHGHPPGVRSVAISPDGNLVAAGGDGGKILIWDLAKPGRPRWSFDPPRAPNGRNDVHAVDFSGDGRELIAGYERGGVRIWRLSTAEGRPVAGWPRPTPVTSQVSTNWEGADPEPEQRGERPASALALDRPSGRAVVGDFSGRLFGVDLAKASVRWTVQLDILNVAAVALVPGEDIVVAADPNGQLRAVAPESGAALSFSSRPHGSRLVVLRYLPERKRLLSLDSTGNLVFWKRSRAGFEVEEKNSLPFSPLTAELDLARSRLLMSSRGGEIRTFSLESREELTGEVLQGHRMAPLAIRCSEAHPRCASGGVGGEVLVWNRERPHPLVQSTRPVSDPVLSLRHRSDGKLELLTQPEKGGIAWTSVTSPEPIHRRVGQAPLGAGAQDDGESIVLGLSDGRVLLLKDPAAKDAVPLRLANPEPGGLYRFAVSSRFVAGADKTHLFVWRREHPAAPVLSTRLDDMVSTLRFSPDERLLVAGQLHGRLARWDLTQTPPPMQSRQAAAGPIFALAFSPDGSQLFTGSGAGDRHIRQWDPRSLRLIQELPEQHTASLSQIGVSLDSKLLVSTADDGEAVLWDTGTWREVGSLPHGIDTLFQAIAFDRGSTRLVTAGDREIWTWRITDQDALDAACRLANRTIPQDEWSQSVGGSQPVTACPRPPAP